ncbi:MAG: hypothetical protein COZ37_06240 [bacterium (Candidatus Ratteibacteria) CG_4_10_14_3_um_filter_41_18]|uniref:PilZ domain-containing protein n=3 Tax=Candidatus Ratteibacteria TaxID=2979319 RepID=A0A2M7YFF4_9BACT|nr:MAG: hypothetical protein AUJ76_03025 [Candidatus Omnitrophica bacterium CG1_02_41_171]PIW31654.1 MAG: hypothetical protein COW28_06950 [bacterium (Candidatus Ratteibacteria) CG15_BIG_FIL_POST_REV_8_21_14_020_41_12]PIW74186.1 MAG: hypothetical protein CO004_01975 [bacterium (Candidatus Ratteibacteria) CG_4_8_14_3_um_filter_41_36]PIX76750.1 MAG: hypothetical protein COZ37_06240 [bacterium (Candidatus Ratteibacteria) CG_4_10_14_3_um_filter_41_18]PJA61692.1 MAG: hypothetical protein CO162_04925
MGKEKRMYAGSEKRQFVRVSLPFFVRYQKKEKGKIIIGGKKLAKNLTENIENLSVTKDISQGGIKFVAKERFEPGTSLALDIYAPDRKTPIRTLAKVIWVKNRAFRSGYETGACFTTIEKGDREDLSFYLSALQRVGELIE